MKKKATKKATKKAAKKKLNNKALKKQFIPKSGGSRTIENDKPAPPPRKTKQYIPQRGGSKLVQPGKSPGGKSVKTTGGSEDAN